MNNGSVSLGEHTLFVSTSARSRRTIFDWGTYYASILKYTLNMRSSYRAEFSLEWLQNYYVGKRTFQNRWMIIKVVAQSVLLFKSNENI